MLSSQTRCLRASVYTSKGDDRNGTNAHLMRRGLALKVDGTKQTSEEQNTAVTVVRHHERRSYGSTLRQTEFLETVFFLGASYKLHVG